jgi:hypothetical protein
MDFNAPNIREASECQYYVLLLHYIVLCCYNYTVADEWQVLHFDLSAKTQWKDRAYILLIDPVQMTATLSK